MSKLTTADRKALERARDCGFLQAGGDEESQRRQRDAWFLFCREHGLDCLIASPHEDNFKLEVDLATKHVMSHLFYAELERLYQRMQFDGAYGGGGFSIDNVSFESVGALIDKILVLIDRDRSSERRLELETSSGAEGMAAVLEATGLWEDLPPGDQVYIREIPGRPGRCIALSNGRSPRVDMPLSQFKVLAEPDV